MEFGTLRAVGLKPWSLELTLNDLVIAKNDTEVDTNGNKGNASMP